MMALQTNLEMIIVQPLEGCSNRKHKVLIHRQAFLPLSLAFSAFPVCYFRVLLPPDFLALVPGTLPVMISDDLVTLHSDLNKWTKQQKHDKARWEIHWHVQNWFFRSGRLPRQRCFTLIITLGGSVI